MAAKQIVLQSDNLQVTILQTGCAIQKLAVKDAQGQQKDVVLGFEVENEYKEDGPYFGVIVGRVANRIKGGQFKLDDQIYNLNKNDNGRNSSHGGNQGFDKKQWSIINQNNSSVSLQYISLDGEEGYPGQVTTLVTYNLTPNNELEVIMEAETTKKTPINLAQHSYFNLEGHQSNKVADHIIQIKSDKYTELDEDSAATGNFIGVNNTGYDLRKPTNLGQAIKSLNQQNIIGHDVSYVLVDESEYKKDFNKQSSKLVAKAFAPSTGLLLEVSTNMPAVQLYTGNYLTGVKGKGGITYQKQSGFCLETQLFPNGVNIQNFPTTIINPGQKYLHKVNYKFTKHQQNLDEQNIHRLF